MGKTYLGDSNNDSAKVKKIYLGDSNNESVRCKVAYVGDSNGRSVEIYRDSTLPAEYQKVEYIFNSGGDEYIDTGILMNSDTTFFLEIMRTDAATTGSGIYVLGSSQIRTGKYYYCEVILTNTNYVDIDFDDQTSSSIGTYTRNQKLTIDYNKPGGYFYIDGTLVSTRTNTFSAYEYSVVLFAYRLASSINISREGLRMYHFQAWQSGVMIRDMYPCYLKSDSQTVGMYDLIGGQFYGNDGTGIFYKGPDVA